MDRKIPKNMTILPGTTESGERVETLMPRRRKRVKGWRDRTGLIDYKHMAMLQMNGTQWRVLWAVMQHVPPLGGRDAFCTQAELAEVLDMHRVTVGQTLLQLRDRHIVWNTRRGHWRVSAWLMYNGDYNSWNAECELDEEPVWMRNVDPATGEITG